MRRRFFYQNTNDVGYISSYFTIEALEDELTASLSTNACEYRIDDGSWNNLSAGSNTPSINKGQTLSFRGNLTPTSSSGIGTFTISKKCNLKGNIMSLLYCDDLIWKTDLSKKNYAFYCLFYDCTNIIDASELVLPATKLAQSCYLSMFNGCTSLTTAPKLPATTVPYFGYCSMFSGCTSLTTAPELPATKLAQSCYDRMFNGTNVLPDCGNIDFTSESVVASGGLQGLFTGTKVTDADLERILPKNNKGKYCLPVTTLTNSCYYYMFSGCTSLTTAPELPATALTNYCYNGMFYGCSKLNYIKMLATDISASNCLTNWVSYVSSTGTFVKNAATDIPTGVSGIPSGWTVKDTFTPVECISLSITADNVSGKATTTKIQYTAELYGYDDNNNYTTITKIGETVSEEFPQNTSETETVTRSISYTYMGVTATTTIIQGVWVNSQYTVNLNSNWQLSTAVSNPDSNTYDGVYESYSNYNVNNEVAIMYIDIEGYTDFKLYIRSYAESIYDYVMVSQPDQTITGSISYSDTTLIKAHTRGSQNSGTSISSYKLVEFTGMTADPHRITIVYRKDGSSHSGTDKGYLLIPKNQ